MKQKKKIFVTEEHSLETEKAKSCAIWSPLLWANISNGS